MMQYQTAQQSGKQEQVTIVGGRGEFAVTPTNPANNNNEIRYQ